nr:Chain P, IPS peptide from CMV, IPSINVHHY [Human herpesvirus 5 strain Towne]
IPSINVHHY